MLMVKDFIVDYFYSLLSELLLSVPGRFLLYMFGSLSMASDRIVTMYSETTLSFSGLYCGSYL